MMMVIVVMILLSFLSPEKLFTISDYEDIQNCMYHQFFMIEM